jgi:D-tyrosyl-tRNA(Tyr) deacylase
MVLQVGCGQRHQAFVAGLSRRVHAGGGLRRAGFLGEHPVSLRVACPRGVRAPRRTTTLELM